MTSRKVSLEWVKITLCIQFKDRMNFLRSKVNQVRHFPAYHETVAQLDDMNKGYGTVLAGAKKAFGAEFIAYAKGQKEEFVGALTDMCDAGVETTKMNEELHSQLVDLPKDMAPLLAQETEMSKWREARDKAIATAKSSRTDFEKAEAAYEKAKNNGNENAIKKTEGAFAAAQRKMEQDEATAEDQTKSVEEKQEPYRAKFLESFVTPMIAAIDLRFKAAEKMIALSESFKEAAEKMHDYEDPAIQRHKTIVAELDSIVVE